MAKKQLRIKSNELEKTQASWLGQTVSVVLHNGAVYEACPSTLEAGVLYCRDGLRLKHQFPVRDIKEIILYFPVAEHAQTSAD